MPQLIPCQLTPISIAGPFRAWVTKQSITHCAAFHRKKAPKSLGCLSTAFSVRLRDLNGPFKVLEFLFPRSELEGTSSAWAMAPPRRTKKAERNVCLFRLDSKERAHGLKEYESIIPPYTPFINAMSVVGSPSSKTASKASLEQFNRFRSSLSDVYGESKLELRCTLQVQRNRTLTVKEARYPCSQLNIHFQLAIIPDRQQMCNVGTRAGGAPIRRKSR